jgi:hypothetical protein
LMLSRAGRIAAIFQIMFLALLSPFPCVANTVGSLLRKPGPQDWQRAKRLAFHRLDAGLEHSQNTLSLLSDGNHLQHNQADDGLLQMDYPSAAITVALFWYSRRQRSRSIPSWATRTG